MYAVGVHWTPAWHDCLSEMSGIKNPLQKDSRGPRRHFFVVLYMAAWEMSSARLTWKTEPMMAIAFCSHQQQQRAKMTSEKVAGHGPG